MVLPHSCNNSDQHCPCLALCHPLLSMLLTMQPRPGYHFPFCLQGHIAIEVTCAQLGAHQDPQGLLCQAAFQSVSLQLLLVPGDAPPQLQDLALAFAELHDIPAGPFLQPAVSGHLWMASQPLVHQPLLPVQHCLQICLPDSWIQ